MAADPSFSNIRDSYPRVYTFLLVGFCSYVLIWFLQVGYRVSALAELRVEYIVAATLTALSFIFRPRAPKSAGKKQGSTLALYIAAFFLCIAIQLPYSYDPETSLIVFRDRVVKFAFMAFFMTQFIRSPRDMRFFLFAFLLACAYITQESFRAALTGSMVWQNQGIPRLHGDTPLFRHPNSLAGLAIGALPFIYFLLPVVKKKFLRLMLLGASATSLGCVMYTGSRTAYLAMLVFGAFIWLSSKRKTRFIAIALLLGAAAWPGIPDHYKIRFRSIFTGEEIEGASTSKRKEILRDAAAVFKSRPLGVGVAAFPTVRQRVFGRVQDTHNLYLEAATNLGVQGLVVFCFLIYKLMKSLQKVRISLDSQIKRVEKRLHIHSPTDSGKEDSPVLIPLRKHLDDLRLLRAACLAGMGYIVIRLVMGFFGHDLYEIYWWIGTGMALSLLKINQFSTEITDRLAAPARRISRSSALDPEHEGRPLPLVELEAR